MKKVEKSAYDLIGEITVAVEKDSQSIRNITSKVYFVKFLLENNSHSFLLPSGKWNDFAYATHNIGKKFERFIIEFTELNPGLKDIFSSDDLISLEDKFFTGLLQIFNKYSLNQEQTQDFHYTGTFFKNMIQAIVYGKGNKSSDYYTAPFMNELLGKILKPEYGTYYDGAAGIGDSLVCAKLSGSELKVFGQEVNPQLVEIAYINYIVHGLGIDDFQLNVGNTLSHPTFVADDEELKKFDYISMQPPFGMKLEKQEMDGVKNYSGAIADIGAGSGELAFLYHLLSSLKSSGKGAAITTNGILTRGGFEEKFREVILKEDWLETVISLPAKLLSYTAIPVTILIFDKDKDAARKRKVQFMMIEEATNINRYQRILETDEIESIATKYRNFEDNGTDARIVDVEEIYANDGVLNPKLYFATHIVDSQIGTVTIHMDKYEQLVEKKVSLKDIAEIKRGVNLPSKRNIQEEGELGYKVIQLKDVQDDQIDFIHLETLPVKNIQSYIVEAGDIIIASRGTAFKVAIVPEHEETVVLSNMFIRLRLKNPNYTPEYMKAFLESPVGMFLLESTQKGTVMKVITPKDVEKIDIPYKTLEEQAQLIEHLQSMKETQQELQHQLKQLLADGYKEAYKQMGIQEVIDIKK